jgi:AbiV family abortive infection protein
MVKKSLDQYKGRLSPEQIAEGMNAAVRNATRLVDDANLLLQRKRFRSAVALAILAIEEAGKSPILRRMSVVQDDPKALKDCWRDYRSHTKKYVSWLLPQLYVDGARRLDDLYSLHAEGASHPFALEQLKQISLYTDCLGNAHWSIPEDEIDEQRAKMLVQNSRVLVKHPELDLSHLSQSG